MLTLTFGDAAVLADGTRFFADTVATRFGINCLGFMARAANWYPTASMQAAAHAVAYTLAGRFHLRSAGYYATAERDGTVWRTASQPRKWEVYEEVSADSFGMRDCG